jgi:hypothetical protein
LIPLLWVVQIWSQLFSISGSKTPSSVWRSPEGFFLI